MEIRYPPAALPGESRVEWERRALNPWRQQEKRRLMLERGYICERCGQQAAIDLDESLIPRCDMGGFDLDQRRIAFSSPNLTLACMDCNREQAHDRDAAWKRAVARYGEDTVRAWYFQLHLKAPRIDWLP